MGQKSRHCANLVNFYSNNIQIHFSPLTIRILWKTIQWHFLNFCWGGRGGGILSLTVEVHSHWSWQLLSSFDWNSLQNLCHLEAFELCCLDGENKVVSACWRFFYFFFLLLSFCVACRWGFLVLPSVSTSCRSSWVLCHAAPPPTSWRSWPTTLMVTSEPIWPPCAKKQASGLERTLKNTSTKTKRRPSECRKVSVRLLKPVRPICLHQDIKVPLDPSTGAHAWLCQQCIWTTTAHK